MRPNRIWCGVALSAGGVATFNVTEDGTAGGTALFADLTDVTKAAITHGAYTNTSTLLLIPYTSMKSRTTKVVVVNVVVPAVVAVLGVTPPIALAADGTEVHLTIMGISA